MAQSKAAKRKRKAQADADASNKAGKAAKTSATAAATTPLEPETLQAVISNEELDITIETLATLAQHPSLTKAKPCKKLRAAVYDFRQSCTTGVNAASAEGGGNLTARVTAALADERYLEARILLAEMRLRGQEPKLGALCRWVRDLDVVTQPRGASIDAPDRPARDKQLLEVLDAVLRVSCPVDDAAGARPPSRSSTHIALQDSWDLRPAAEPPHPVYASVLDGSILSPSPSPSSSLLRVIETTPGPLRKPPNRHPAVLYTNNTNTYLRSAYLPSLLPPPSVPPPAPPPQRPAPEPCPQRPPPRRVQRRRRRGRERRLPP